MNPQRDYEQFLDKYADLDVHESAHWLAALAGHLARFKRPNLAIVAITAIAYKSLPTPIMLAVVGAITLLGVIGGLRDG
ncbi:hypothetical protein OKW49_005318 [Paraburkholderia youngii]|uniref:hypothetical protein n=1 Tax=Paraburkholderia youngii TaxID=2782701 RepID=UPI003D1CB70E